MTDRFTAKTKIHTREGGGSGTVRLTFEPDYGQGKNAEWAEATPSLHIAMNVKTDVAEGIEVGDTFTLTFEKTVD